MKTNTYYSTILLFIVIGFGLSSCKKDDDKNGNNTGNSGVSMKIDGVQWGTTVNNLFTEADENQSLGEHYRVLVGGQRIDVEGSEDDVSSLNLYILIPKSKFNNPKGTYQIRGESETNNQATALFTPGTSTSQTWYISNNPENPEVPVGTVEITDFETGIQTVAGQSTGVEGYTKLAGKFTMTLYPVESEPGPSIKITDGKFNLKSGIGFDFQ